MGKRHKAKNDYHCDICGLEADQLYYHLDQEICEACRKKLLEYKN